MDPVKGLSLLELMVVLFIVGLATMFLVPRFTGSLSRLELKTSAQKASSALRYARSQAVAQQATYYAVFDFEKNACFIKVEKPDEEHSEDTNARSESMTDESGGSLSRASLVKTYFLPENVKIEKAEVNDKEISSGSFVIEFYPTGNSNGGTLTFIDEKQRMLKINVNFITGMVDIAETDHSKQ